MKLLVRLLFVVVLLIIGMIISGAQIFIRFFAIVRSIVMLVILRSLIYLLIVSWCCVLDVMLSSIIETVRAFSLFFFTLSRWLALWLRLMALCVLGLAALIVGVIWVVEVCVGISAINQGQASSFLFRCHPFSLPLIISVVIGTFINSSHSFNFLFGQLWGCDWLHLT